uniref:Uncharacterized protein n=1 Tax=Setaria digitata TaxID=48799 RepID=A0A915Q672_9BILA
MCLCLSKTANRIGNAVQGKLKLGATSTTTTNVADTIAAEVKPKKRRRSKIAPRLPASPVPPFASTLVTETETSTKSAGVSALTQQFEMNARKQWTDESTSRPISGNKWTPKGGPKPKELQQLLPTVEFKTTPLGGKYKKIDYEVVDAEVIKSGPEDSTSMQHSLDTKREESSPDTSSDTRYISPIRQTEQITVYEYDSQEISRRRGEKPSRISLHEYEPQKLVEESIPHRHEWMEERKTEVWSKTSKGAWQYDIKHFPPVAVTPPATTGDRGLWESSESQHRGSISTDEKPVADAVGGSTSSSTIMVKQDHKGRILASETWDTKRQTASYSTASTLEKTRELDEEVAQKEEIRRRSPVWAIIKSTRQDESKEKEEDEKYRKPEEREALSSYSSSIDTHTSKWGKTDKVNNYLQLKFTWVM